MKRPTELQLSVMQRVATSGWDNVDGAERTSARRRPDLLYVEIDWEAGDPEHGDRRYVARLTDEGAQYLQREFKMRLERDDDGSWGVVR